MWFRGFTGGIPVGRRSLACRVVLRGKGAKVEKGGKMNRLEGWLESLEGAAPLPSGWTGVGRS